MGNRYNSESKREQKANAEINRSLKREGKRINRHRKLLIFGGPQSGKSTFYNQLKLLSSNGLSQRDRLNMKPQIYQYVIQSTKEIIQCIKHCPDSIIRSKQTILDWHDDHNGHRNQSHVYDDVIHHIHTLWQHECIKAIIDNASVHRIDDSIIYFFNKLNEMDDYNRYIPTDDDIIYCHTKNEIGLKEIIVPYYYDTLHIMDVSYDRNIKFRKKLYMMGNATAIIFVASLSCIDEITFNDYDMTYVDKLKWKNSIDILVDNVGKDLSNLILSFVGDSENAMTKQLELFENISNNKWFRKCHIILILNKTDRFRQKIENKMNNSFKICFPSFKGDSNSFEECKKYIVDRFCEHNKGEWADNMYVHDISGSEQDLIQKIGNDVREIVLTNSLYDGGYIDSCVAKES